MRLGGQLLSGRMIQHELLMIVAAPLLVLGRPLAAWAWALPPAWRRATGALFHAPAWRTPWLVLTGHQSYVATAPAYGFAAIEDQQLGGVVMWVPAGLVYVIVGLTFAARWLGRPARGLS